MYSSYFDPEEEAAEPSERLARTEAIAPEPDIRGPEQDVRQPELAGPSSRVLRALPDGSVGQAFSDAVQEPSETPFTPQQRIGYNGSGYVLTAEEQKQVEDLDGAISKVKQQDDLDDVQKGMALQQLQQKRHALDPGGNYGPRSPRGQMTPAAKWASQNVYKDPQSGLIFYNDGHGWKHVKDEHADRVHQAVIKAKDHAHEQELNRQARAQELEVKRQERADTFQRDTEGKKKKDDQATSKEIYDHAKQRVKDVMQHNKDLISSLDPETAKKFAKMTAEEKAEFGIQKIPTLEDAEDAEVESRAKRGLSTGLHKSVGQREAADLLTTVPKGSNGGFDLTKDTNVIRLNKIDKMLDKPWLLGVSQAEADAFRRLVKNRIAQLTVQQ